MTTADFPEEQRIPIASDADVVRARQAGRALALVLGFAGSDPMFVATAISEIARNIVVHAKRGEISLVPVSDGTRGGILVVAKDDGPGIPDIPLAMKDGYSTVKSLGLGLPGARRLMDEFDVESQAGKGTTVTMRKWTRRPGW